MRGHSYRTLNGTTVLLGDRLGKGGEGTVYSVERQTNLAAKIYRPELAASRRDKVLAMVTACWHSSTAFVAFPVDALHDPRTGAFVGFTMHKVGRHKAVHELYSPSSRKVAFPKATYPFLVRVVTNVARAVAGVHATGCTIGDVNHSGFLVAQDATVMLIDSDSFQVSHAGKMYPCKVGVPEFTPPELQGQRLDQVVRTQNHDAFGLAVLAFYTLMMGRHPYAGRFSGPGDMPLERAITEYRFAYSARRAATGMDPPPDVPTLGDLPMPLADAFERAFGPAGAHARPTAAEWASLSHKSEAELVACRQNAGHHFFRPAASCPWCRMEQAHPGFLAFPPTIQSAVAGTTPINLGQLIALVRGVPDPGQAPNLASIMPQVPEPAPSTNAVIARRARRKRWTLGGLGIGLGLALLNAGGNATLFGLVASVAGGIFAFRAPEENKAISDTIQKGRLLWRDAEEAFRRSAGNEHFRKLREEAETRIRELQLLPGEEKRRLSELDAKRREMQLKHYLERFPIERAKIKGIGDARKLTLRSYFIETAADINRRQIEAIPGFGPATAQALVNWRLTIESKFQFDPRQPVNPQDIAAVKSDVAQRTSNAERRLKQLAALLQNENSNIAALRANPGASTLAAWHALKQSEVDSAALAAGPDVARLVAFGVAGLFVYTFVAAELGSMRQAPFPRKQAPSQVERPQSPSETPAIVPAPSRNPNAPATPRVSAPPTSKPVELKPGSRVDSDSSSSEVPPEASARPPPLPPPIIIDALPMDRVPSAAPIEGVQGAPPPVLEPEPLLDLAIPSEAAQVQRRLAELGYYAVAIDGAWGPRSRQALAEFRERNGLGPADQWDRRTQELLLSESAIGAGTGPLILAPPSATRPQGLPMRLSP